MCAKVKRHGLEMVSMCECKNAAGFVTASRSDAGGVQPEEGWKRRGSERGGGKDLIFWHVCALYHVYHTILNGSVLLRGEYWWERGGG